MDASELISLYSSLFYASLALCLLGLGCAVLFFFLFDIPTVFSQLTGIGKERALKRMRETSKGLHRSGASGNLTSGGLGTGELPSGGMQGTAPLEPAAQPATAILTETPVEEIRPVAGATAILEPMGTPAAPVEPAAAWPGPFEIFERVMEIHTDEII